MGTKRGQGRPEKVVAYLPAASPGAADLVPAAKAWAAARGAKLWPTFRADPQSAARPVQERGEFLAVLRAVRVERAHVLLVASAGALAEDLVLLALVEHDLERLGAEIAFLEPDPDPEREQLEELRQVLRAYDAYRTAKRSAGARAGRAAKRASHRPAGGTVPYGFRRSSDEDALACDGEEQETIRIALGYRAQGRSLRWIGERLAQLGHRPRNGGHWHAKTVRALVTGPGARYQQGG